MRYTLLIHVGSQAWDGLGGWPQDEVKAMVAHMRELDADLRAPGELVDLNGLAGPRAAKTVRARPDGDAVVSDGLRGEGRDSLIGYWVVDVASPERAIEIATRISATPALDGVAVDQPVEIHPIGEAPEL